MSAIENVAVINQSAVTSSSGSSAVVTTASSAPPIITVQFADGTQGRYAIKQAAGPFTVGQPVSLIPDGNGFTIMSP
ncbi:hypothetical protein D3870_18785 [Noviherbaspirillum cavernae]|uniref:Uncharacterized protein n=1 Tax=Noviherbaspirillum cavernae TaxID=2320862 RepID=A0A418WVB0_9BURK|nr:hypothetical protein D3870_18785 [Noviherbaspirillum cavernae]